MYSAEAKWRSRPPAQEIFQQSQAGIGALFRVKLGTGLVAAGDGGGHRSAVPVVNHIRIPALAAGLTLLMFLPGIIEQGSRTYLAATGQTQEPFLGRWLWLTAALFGVSAVIYAVRLVRARRSGTAELTQ